MTTKQPPSALTLNVFKAYLNPLLKKHESGKVIVYEDLLASWDAVEAILSKSESAPDASDVKEKIKTLHDEQVLEYKKAGKRALIDYSRTCSLPVGDSSDPNHTLKCIRHALNGAPHWKLPRSTVLAILQKVIQMRLNSASASSPSAPSQASASQTPAATSQTTPPPKALPKQNEPVPASTLEEGEEEEQAPAVEGGETASGDEGEVEEGEEGEEEEDDDEEEEDEEGEDDAADGDTTGKSEKKGSTTNNRSKGLLAKKKALGKTTGPKKKGTVVKGGRTGARGGRMPRRGGRGGGKA